MNLIKLASLMALLAAAPGCSGGTKPATCTFSGYADGGTPGVGSTMENLTLVGSQHYNTDGSPVDGTLKNLTLESYRADPKNKVLAILVAAEWCIPCQTEQAEVVPAYNNYKSSASGVAIVEAITQKVNNSPADQGTIDAWAKRYGVPFDLTTDAAGALAKYSNSMLFPSQLVITTCDMKIQWMHNGYEAGSLENAIDAALAL